MNMCFRWYGPDDPVPLHYIRQIPGVTGIVSALHDVPLGVPWQESEVAKLRESVEAVGLTLEVIESIPVPESIKLGTDDREAQIENFCHSLEAVGAQGIPVVCYNFMPVFDWLRTNLALRLEDASTALSYSQEELDRIDFSRGTGDLPGWAAAYSGEELAALREAYSGVSEGQLWDNLAYFLEKVVPVAESSGVKLGIHPDDPPWPVGGFPRIITSAEALRRVVSLVTNSANGITLCTGSLGADPGEAARLPETVHSLGRRIHFMHCRNVQTTSNRAFHESPHRDGDVDLSAVIRALREIGFDGPMRPDHGRMIWGERGRPGYGLYDRALGASYLLGLWDASARLQE